MKDIISEKTYRNSVVFMALVVVMFLLKEIEYFYTINGGIPFIFCFSACEQFSE